MSKTKPVIILITTDEQHCESLSSWGAKSHATPNIDSIGKKGDFYTNCYTASPICLPARCSIATGLYPHNTRSYSNRYGASLNPALPNLFSICRDAGYVTSLHGKGHFTPCPYGIAKRYITKELAIVKPFYLSLGMDYCDLQDDKNNSLWFYDDYSTDLEKNNLLKTARDARAGKIGQHTAGYFFPGPREMHPDSWVGQKAVEYIEAAEQEKPYFLWVSFSGPHYPIDTPREYYDLVNIENDNPRIRKEGEFSQDTKSGYHSYHGPRGTEGCAGAPGRAQKNYTQEYWREWRRMYYGNVLLIDDYVGRILDAAENKWGDNILVIFTSDHGDMMGNHDMWGKNLAVYEDVVKVPFMIKYPGQTQGNIHDELISSIDIFPTIASYAGYDKPYTCDGKPLAELKQGHDYVLSEAEGRMFIITKNKEKLVHSRTSIGSKENRVEREYFEYYDLEKDPYEFTNRYKDPACGQGLSKCREIYGKYQKEIDNILFFDKYGEEVPPWFIE